MKVLIIDPWCSDEYEVYTIGLCEELAKLVQLSLCCSYYETRKSDKYAIVPCFFSRTDKMKRSIFRTLLRGFEYFFNYSKIYRLVKKERFDVVHVEWMLLDRVDYFWLKKIKKYTKKLVFTSHNVIPHVGKPKKYKSIRKLHSLFDSILVHGESIKEEYLKYYPEDSEKLQIQRHGIHFSQQTSFDKNKVDEKIVNFTEESDSTLAIVVGNIFYNKGTDRVINYWNKKHKNDSLRLLVAGSVTKPYQELESSIKNAKDRNILILQRFLNADEYAFVLEKSSFVIIPYRHASMSGIVYSAAAFSKPIVYTDTGSIKEYIGSECGFMSQNSDKELEKTLDHVCSLDDLALKQRGSNLHNWIYSEFGWSNISKKLVENVYNDGGNV